MYDFGQTLKQIRKSKNITQQKLASKLDVSEAMISKYENNISFPTFDKMRCLAVELSVSLDELFGVQSNGNVSLYGLSESQAKIIIDLIHTFRNEKKSANKTLSQNQSNMIARIVSEFLIM